MAETSDYGGTNEYIPIERLEYDPERDKIVIKEYNPGLEGIGDPWMPAGDYTPPEPQWNNPPSSWDTYAPTSFNGAWDYSGYPAASFLPTAPSPAVLTPNAPAPYTPEIPGFTTKAPSWYGGDTQSFISDVLNSYLAPDPVAYPDLWRAWVKRHEGEPGAVQSSGWYLGPSGEHLPFYGAAYLPPESVYLPTAPAAPSPTSFADIRHDPDLLDRYYRGLDVYRNALGRGLTDAERRGLASAITSGRAWNVLDELRERQLKAAERYGPKGPQAEDYGLRHPGFPSNIVYSPNPPAWGSPTLTLTRPATDRSLWGGSAGKSDTLNIPTPLVYDARPPFHYTPPDVYPDLPLGSAGVLRADTPIFGGMYKSAYDAWHGSADQPPELRALGYLPQTIANSAQNFSEFFNPVRGFAGAATPGPRDVVTGAFDALIGVPVPAAARAIGDIARGDYSDLGRLGIQTFQDENRAQGNLAKGVWELTPWGGVEAGTRAAQELTQYIKEGKSLSEVWQLYDQKYKELDPLTKALVDIVIDPLNFAQFLGAANKLSKGAKETVQVVNPIEKSIKALGNIQDLAGRLQYLAEQLKDLFDNDGGSNFPEKLESPSSPLNRAPSEIEIATQSSAAKGATTSKPSAGVADQFAPATFAGSNADADAVTMQAALDALARTGVAPTGAAREALYQLYVESGSALPFEQWLMLLATGPAYSPSAPA